MSQTDLDHAPTGQGALLASVRALLAAVFGRLLADASVSNILILPPTGAEGGPARVLVRDGAGLHLSHTVPVAEVRRLLAYLAGLARRELRPGRATLDAVMPGGERLHAVIDPIAPGPAVAVRKPLPGRVTLDDWCAWGALSPA
ncbi:MAG: Flp pilus assembly complex ATPase component TadA [Pseudomonadota bacterium]